MSALWTSSTAMAAVGGISRGAAWEASGVSIDTRTLEPGDLFVALHDRRDGHDFVADAFRKGAAAALVSRVPEGVGRDASLLICDEVQTGLERLAAVSRSRTVAKVIAVTGSAGKTSTKEMLRHVLGRQGRTHASEASFNNHWGVPLTLARMPPGSEFAVIEIGMNRPGEIVPLARMARPHVAIVTTVASAHLEAFSGIEEIAIEKGSVFQGLEPGGVAIFNADVETAPILEAEARLHAARQVGFGEGVQALLRAERVTLTAEASVVEGRFEHGSFHLKIGAPGRHLAMNAMSAIGAASLAGADLDVAVRDIGSWTVPKGRGRRETILLGPVDNIGILLIDDAFNANPASMEAAMEVLAASEPAAATAGAAGGRRIAILGDMLELGAGEALLHSELAGHFAMERIDRVICVGQRVRALHDVLAGEPRSSWFETAEELAATVRKHLTPGDVVLVKGSKGSKV
ncbi:MAG: UDP-N-acetylmuramoyl-tripeptide--D-alanyl-D-alanine ligase, partial [Boseongicola sp. SB0676_bin_33]|nr:UDP-N-acetylmuramoyl-tripeptide--D-alanyl-D-alanine ligase [Boseongicola sp. SB0676_bin_33]